MGEIEDRARALQLRLQLQFSIGGQEPAGQTVLGTFADGGRVIRNANGSLQAVSAGGSTTDPAAVERIMAGEGFSSIVQDSVDQQRIAQNPVAARASEVVRGVPFIGSYADEAVGIVSPEARDNMRATTGAMQRQNPGQTTALNIAGGVLGAVPMAMAAAPSIAAMAPSTVGAQAVGGAVLGATTGAVEGAVYGAGEGTDRQDRVAAAQRGAAVGAGVGGVLGAASPYAARAINATLDRLRGSDVATIVSTLGISRTAATAVRNALQSGDMRGAESALQRAGPDAMLADAGIPARQMLDAVAQAGGPAGTTVREAVDARTQAATRNITGALDQGLGTPRGIGEITDQIRTETAPQRSAAYQAAYAAPIDYSAPDGRRIESLLPRVPASAWRRADQLMSLEGEESMQRLFSIADDGSVTVREMPDVRQLDYLTRALNDVASEADGQGKLGGTTDLGRLTGNLSREIRQSVRSAVPEYGAALDTAADAISRRNAAEVGRTLLRPQTTREDVARALSSASEAERRAAQEGLRSQIDDTMANVVRTMTDPDTTTREGIRALRDLSSRANQEKLRILMGRDAADSLLSEVDQAATAYELRAAIADNSRTAVRQSVQGTIDEATQGGIVRTLASGEPVNSTKLFVQALTGETLEARQLRRMGIYDEIATALTQIRGSQAQTALRIINTSIEQQRPITEAQARRVAEILTGANLGVERATGVLTDGRANTQ